MQIFMAISPFIIACDSLCPDITFSTVETVSSIIELTECFEKHLINSARCMNYFLLTDHGYEQIKFITFSISFLGGVI